MSVRGHCLCGATSWETDGQQNWAGFCHCESCRRKCAAPVTAFLGVENGHWQWTGQVPGAYASSDHATRYFCSTCGTTMAYASTRFPNEIHFYGASLANPSDFAPTQHFHHDERLAWLHLTDDLKKHHSSADGDFA